MSVFDAARNKTSFAQPIEHELYARPKVGSSSLRCDDLGHNALFSIRLDRGSAGTLDIRPISFFFGEKRLVSLI